jgi:hypothetical protein
VTAGGFDPALAEALFGDLEDPAPDVDEAVLDQLEAERDDDPPPRKAPPAEELE